MYIYAVTNINTFRVVYAYTPANTYSSIWRASPTHTAFSLLRARSSADCRQTWLLSSMLVVLHTVRYVMGSLPMSAHDHQCDTRAIDIRMRLEKCSCRIKLLVVHGIKTWWSGHWRLGFGAAFLEVDNKEDYAGLSSHKRRKERRTQSWAQLVIVILWLKKYDRWQWPTMTRCL